MSSCLGIYIGDKVVKYARLVKEEKTSDIKTLAYGTRIHLGNKSDVISSIVNDTGSEQVPICINAEGEKAHKTEVLKIIGKNDLESLIDLEVIDFTGNEDRNDRSHVYRYTLLDSMVSKDNYAANILVQDRVAVDKYLKDENSQVVSMYSLPYILDEIVTRETQNYLIINMNEDTDLIFVNNGKLINISKMDIGLKKMMDEFPEVLGSYQKSYDTCKTINVFTDESNVNNPELERIIEPILQDVLNRIQSKLGELNLRVDKIYLNGLITLFINSDMLFEEYFEIPTEKLRPYFIDPADSNYNMAEVTEANEAFALAYEGLNSERTELDFLKQGKKKNDFFTKTAPKKKNTGARELSRENNNSKVNRNDNVSIGGISLGKVIPVLIYANVIVFLIFMAYSIFSYIYGRQLDTQIASAKEEQTRIQQTIESVNTDITYINGNAKTYQNYTSYINETVRKIKNQEIGKYSTYNVALFMLKITKYIPKDVRLVSIKSDNNKHVTITCTSNSHAALGYFVSQLEFEEILDPSTVRTTAVVHDSLITVTIGGDLP